MDVENIGEKPGQLFVCLSRISPTTIFPVQYYLHNSPRAHILVQYASLLVCFHTVEEEKQIFLSSKDLYLFK